MSQLAGYIGPISTAMWVFPFVALLFTVPYVLSSYLSSCSLTAARVRTSAFSNTKLGSLTSSFVTTEGLTL